MPGQPKSQRWSTPEVNGGQRSKSTLVNGRSQRSTLVKVNGHADVALGLTWSRADVVR
jgi:hypothetical protein